MSGIVGHTKGYSSYGQLERGLLCGNHSFVALIEIETEIKLRHTDIKNDDISTFECVKLYHNSCFKFSRHLVGLNKWQIHQEAENHTFLCKGY